MFGPTPWMYFTFWNYLFPNKSSLLFIQRDRVKITQGTIENLISSVQIESSLRKNYFLLNAQAAL
jgi:hypothetical protein